MSAHGKGAEREVSRRARRRRTGEQPALPRSLETAAAGKVRPRWRARVPPFCRKTLRAIGAEGWDVAILFCDDGTIARLNGKYRGKNRPTDVLSFPRSRERGIVTGDIAISCDSLSRNAEAYGASEDSELRRLLIHGLLHLAGMDHGRGKGRGMLALQERIADRLDGEIIIRGKGA